MLVLSLAIFVSGCDGIDGTGSVNEPDIAPFLQSPFEGVFPVTNVFDHSQAVIWVDNNARQIAFWGEEVVGVPGHRAYDWIMPEGTPLFAAADGVVLKSGLGGEEYCPPLGMTARNIRVVIRHKRSEQVEFVTGYSHVSEVLVETGERVVAGQRIALSGDTGCSTHPHLHFIVQYNGRTEATTVLGSLGVPGQRNVDIDPYGWRSTDLDAWEATPTGSRSWSLWMEGEAPPVRRGWRDFVSPHGSETAPVTIADWVMMGVRDSENLNNEVVELMMNPAYIPSEAFDLTGYTLDNNAGDRFTFPDGFQIVKGQNVRVFSGSGQDTDLDLFWKRNSEAWNNMGDCVDLRSASGDLVHRFEFWSDCQ